MGSQGTPEPGFNPKLLHELNEIFNRKGVSCEGVTPPSPDTQQLRRLIEAPTPSEGYFSMPPGWRTIWNISQGRLEEPSPTTVVTRSSQGDEKEIVLIIKSSFDNKKPPTFWAKGTNEHPATFQEALQQLTQLVIQRIPKPKSVSTDEYEAIIHLIQNNLTLLAHIFEFDEEHRRISFPPHRHLELTTNLYNIAQVLRHICTTPQQQRLLNEYIQQDLQELS